MKRIRKYDGSCWVKIKQDLKHHLDGTFYQTPIKITPARFLRAFITPEFKLLVWFRLYSALNAKGFRILSFWFYQRTKRRFSCDIAPEADIAGGLRVVHCSDIVIGPLVSIGPDSVVLNGVTLGNRKLTDIVWKMPQVGKRVLLGTGAKLLGGIRVGDFASIGANAVLIDDVPDHGTAVGVSAKLYQRSITYVRDVRIEVDPGSETVA